MTYTTLQFNRIAERVVLGQLRKIIIDTVGFPEKNIYFNNPAPQYVNTRTETKLTPNKEEIRYPALSIYSGKEYDDSALNNTYDLQTNNVAVNDDGQVKFYEATYRKSAYYEFVLETTTKEDWYLWKQKMIAFFEMFKAGYVVQNDSLPNKPLMVSMRMNNSVDDTETHPYATMYNVKLYYLVHQEYIANTFETLELHGAIFSDNDVTTDDDDIEDFTFWDNSNPYPD